jgi:hypothetical protein
MKINALRSCSGIHSPTGVVRIILFSNTILQNPGKHELRTDFQEGAFAAFVVVASHGQYFRSHSSEMNKFYLASALFFDDIQIFNMLLRMRGCVNEISVSRIRQSVTQLQNIISFFLPSIIKHTDNTYNNIH